MADDLLIQAPGEELDYAFDWTDWLGADTLAAQDAAPPGSAWTVTPQSGGEPAITFSDVIGDPPKQTVCFLKGLTLGQVYRLTNTVNTVGERTGQKNLTIRCWAP